VDAVVEVRLDAVRDGFFRLFFPLTEYAEGQFNPILQRNVIGTALQKLDQVRVKIPPLKIGAIPLVKSIQVCFQQNFDDKIPRLRVLFIDLAQIFKFFHVFTQSVV
jgi:hypothetical protein